MKSLANPFSIDMQVLADLKRVYVGRRSISFPVGAVSNRAYRLVPVARGPVPRHARCLHQDVAAGRSDLNVYNLSAGKEPKVCKTLMSIVQSEPSNRGPLGPQFFNSASDGHCGRQVLLTLRSKYLPHIKVLTDLEKFGKPVFYRHAGPSGPEGDASFHAIKWHRRRQAPALR